MSRVLIERSSDDSDVSETSVYVARQERSLARGLKRRLRVLVTAVLLGGAYLWFLHWTALARDDLYNLYLMLGGFIIGLPVLLSQLAVRREWKRSGLVKPALTIDSSRIRIGDQATVAIDNVRNVRVEPLGDRWQVVVDTQEGHPLELLADLSEEEALQVSTEVMDSRSTKAPFRSKLRA